MKDILLLLMATGLPFASGSSGVVDRAREIVPMAETPIEEPIIVAPPPGMSAGPAPQPSPGEEEDVAVLDVPSEPASEPEVIVEDAPEPDGSAAYPEFAAGLSDCLMFLTDAGAELGVEGEVVGEGASYAIFYPVMKQPFDFVVSISETATEKACSGQGPLSVPYAEVTANTAELAAFFADYGMVELAFPGEQRAYADCDAAAAVLLTQGDGLTIFAGFTGTNAATYCMSFGRKE
ncbi:MAG: hypothetical protein AAF714_10100 [Pseudomonadota bacterium]